VSQCSHHDGRVQLGRLDDEWHGESGGGRQAAAAVTAALVPICFSREKADVGRATKLGELKASKASYEQTEFVMKTAWATFPGKEEPNRDVAEVCAAQFLKTGAAK
jgi:hypothetical protein